jgi:hypothetical protein
MGLFTRQRRYLGIRLEFITETNTIFKSSVSPLLKIQHNIKNHTRVKLRLRF